MRSRELGWRLRSSNSWKKAQNIIILYYNNQQTGGIRSLLKLQCNREDYFLYSWTVVCSLAPSSQIRYSTFLKDKRDDFVYYRSYEILYQAADRTKFLYLKTWNRKLSHRCLDQSSGMWASSILFVLATWIALLFIPSYTKHQKIFWKKFISNTSFHCENIFQDIAHSVYNDWIQSNRCWGAFLPRITALKIPNRFLEQSVLFGWEKMIHIKVFVARKIRIWAASTAKILKCRNVL